MVAKNEKRAKKKKMDDLFAIVGRDAQKQARAKIGRIATRSLFGGDSPPTRPRRSVPRRSYLEDDDEIEVDVGDLLGGASHHDAVAATLHMNEMLRRQWRTREGTPPRRPIAARAPREPVALDDSELPLVLDSDDSDDSEPHNRELRELLRVHGGRHTLGAQSNFLPATSAKRVAVPVAAYSPPVHVPKRRARPEDTPLREGFVGVERFRESAMDAFSDSQCNICLSTVTRTDTGDERGFILGCGHVLHRACAAHMRRAGLQNCPSCRKPVQWNITLR